MKESDKLIADLIDALDNGVDQFDESIQGSQRAMYARVIELTKELELSGGKIKPSVKNLRIIRNIKAELEKAILNDKYLKSVSKYLAAYAEVEAVQSQYFFLIDKSFTTGAIFKELRNQSVQSAIDQLTENGLRANVTSKAADIIRQSVVGGVKYSLLQEQMRAFLLDDEVSEGALARYAKTYVKDAISAYNSNYTRLATDDLGLEWFIYTGSLKRTSREFCIKMVAAGNGGCMEFIHQSQFKSLVNGIICGEQIPINPKTKLPYGFKENTTAENLIDNKGGHGCNHFFQPVSSLIVPKHLREKYEFARAA